MQHLLCLKYLKATAGPKMLCFGPQVVALISIHSVLFSIKKSLKVPKNTVVNHLKTFNNLSSKSDFRAQDSVIGYKSCLISAVN